MTDNDGVFKDSWEKAIELSKELSASFEPISNDNLDFILKDEKNKEKITSLLSKKEIFEVFPSDIKFLWSSKPEKTLSKKNKDKRSFKLYPCKVPQSGKSLVNGRHIKPGSADALFDPEKKLNTVTLKMTDEGSELWGNMTEANIGRRIAISMDNLVFSAPYVQQKISSNTEISGDFTASESEELKQLLNAGSLDAPCVIKEQTKVGPTIGAENTRSGLISFVVALIVVFIYMYFYYGKAGIVADIA